MRSVTSGEESGVTDQARQIARLEAQVAELERLLARRSYELRRFQKHASHRDLIVLSRICAGLVPVPFGAFDPEFWPETADLNQADVEETLLALWDSLFPERVSP